MKNSGTKIFVPRMTLDQRDQQTSEVKNGKGSGVLGYNMHFWLDTRKKRASSRNKKRKQWKREEQAIASTCSAHKGGHTYYGET